jgi:hypothetical protein
MKATNIVKQRRLTMNYYRYFIRFTVWTLTVITINAATIQVQSPVSSTTIQAAVDSASDGDIIVIPAGTFNINSNVNLKTGIHLRGSGKYATILKKTSTSAWSSIFRLNATDNKSFKLSDISLVGKGLDLFIQDSNSTIIDYGITIFGRVRNFEIYNCKFSRFSGCGIYIYGSANATLLGHATGVIHNNDFIDIYYQTPTSSRGYGVGAYGADGWSVLQLGTSNAIFIENNYFSHNRHCISGNMGIRYVFRYNTIEDNYQPYAAIDTHGTSVGAHGTRSYEIYGNNISGGVEWDNGPGADHPTWTIGIRGGDGVIFDNKFYDKNEPMYTMIEGYDGTGTPDPDRTTDQWLWNNKVNDILYNSMNLGYNSSMENYLDDYLVVGTNIHEDNVAKPNYTPYIYPHPLRFLVAHWKFDKASGTVAVDSSASGNNATIIGAIRTSGYFGNACDFNGTSDYVDCGINPELEISGELSVSAWIYADSGADSTDQQRVIASRYKWQSGGTGKGWYLGSSWQGNNLQFNIYNGSGTHGVTVYNDFFTRKQYLNQWVHVVGVFKPGEYIKLYINGECVATDSSDVPNSIPYVPSTSIVIGKRSDANYFFDGKIDEVKVYTKTLSLSEVKTLYSKVTDGSFENGLGANKSWQVRTGTPTEDTTEVYDGVTAVKFQKPNSAENTESSITATDFISVDGDTDYKISAWGKGENLTIGTSGWHNFRIIGRWYDKNMNMIANSYPDLSFDSGTYNWKLFSRTFRSPDNACYYRITAIGIHRTGTGTAWIDKITFYPLEP